MEGGWKVGLGGLVCLARGSGLGWDGVIFSSRYWLGLGGSLFGGLVVVFGGLSGPFIFVCIALRRVSLLGWRLVPAGIHLCLFRLLGLRVTRSVAMWAVGPGALY